MESGTAEGAETLVDVSTNVHARKKQRARLLPGFEMGRITSAMPPNEVEPSEKSEMLETEGGEGDTSGGGATSASSASQQRPALEDEEEEREAEEESPKERRLDADIDKWAAWHLGPISSPVPETMPPRPNLFKKAKRGAGKVDKVTCIDCNGTFKNALGLWNHQSRKANQCGAPGIAKREGERLRLAQEQERVDWPLMPGSLDARTAVTQSTRDS